MRIIITLSILCLILFASCTDKLIDEEFDNNPVDIFDACWSEYDRNYGAFEAKGINWDSLRTIYRSSLTLNSNNDELYNSLTGLLGNLHDGHVQLIAPGYKRFFSSGVRTYLPDSKYYENGNIINSLFSVVFKKYLNSLKSSGNYFSGYIKSSFTSKSIGYIYISSFSLADYPTHFVDSVLEKYKTADAIIVDLRYNGGGATATFLDLLNHFANKRTLYLKSKLRNGPKHTDFTELYSHYTWPSHGTFEPKPVVVLVNRFSGSSSEHFMLGMQSFPYVTTIGDSTYGALSTVIQKVLPNGWEFRSCPQVLFDTTGHYLANADGRYPDGVGLCPQIYLPNYYKDITTNHDYMMERALKVINEGK